MNTHTSHGRVRGKIFTSRPYMLALVILSLGAVACAFALSLYPSAIETRLRGAAVVAAVYLIACIALFSGHTLRLRRFRQEGEAGEVDIDAHLRILDEATEFFTGALTTPDTFRLVASRIGELVPHEGISLLLFDEQRLQLVAAQSIGTGYEKGSKIALDARTIGQSLEERDVVVDQLTRTAVVPLKRQAEVFGILVFRLGSAIGTSCIEASLLDAIGERIAPLILASIARERSQQNALTDATTELPNERAFNLALENQVAEAIRRGRSRPLTILSFDIRELDAFNSRYGHVAGDCVLNFVAQNAKDSLRQMDFLAKGAADEYLAILPTASKEISHEIIARIQTSLFGRKIKVSDIDTVEVELDFGWASFGVDGEAPLALLAVARERKEQSRSSLAGGVLWFPQEVAH